MSTTFDLNQKLSESDYILIRRQALLNEFSHDTMQALAPSELSTVLPRMAVTKIMVLNHSVLIALKPATGGDTSYLAFNC